MASLFTTSIRAFQLLSILAFSLLIPTVRSQDNALLKKVCSNTFQNSSFATNLTNLLVFLDQTPQNYGFLDMSYGPTDNPVVYGLALCRGDVVGKDQCQQCIKEAEAEITKICNQTTAVVWFDYCHMKYSGENFRGRIDMDNNFTLVTNFNVSGYYNLSSVETEKFKKSSIGLLSKLTKTTPNSMYMFAGNQRVFDKNKNITISVMGQCTRDLSKGNCNKCLVLAMKQLPIYKGSIYSTGQRVVTGSCTVRYDTLGFLISQ